MAKDDRGNTYISEAQSKARAAYDKAVDTRIIAREERQYARANRTDEEQLIRLDKLLGEGVGATRERARLIKQIAQKAATKKKEAAEKAHKAATKERKASKDSD